MKRLLAIVIFAGLGLVVWSGSASASTPGLQINPLQYEDTLSPGQVKSGHVDVANPGDGTVHIVSSVQGFRQTGTDGDLEFFNDPDLSAAIKVDLTDFELGPREAVRVGFTVNSSKLADGSAYASIFFRTVPPDQTSSSNSLVSESARVGTLLLLARNGQTAHRGKISPKLPLFQFDYGVSGSLDYTNTNPVRGVGFRPNLTYKVLPWGHASKIPTGLVLPGTTRRFKFARTASYFGLLPVVFTDLDTHATTTSWVILCTGWYAAGLTFLGALFSVFFVSRVARRQPLVPGFLRRRRQSGARPMDGLSRKY